MMNKQSRVPGCGQNLPDDKASYAKGMVRSIVEPCGVLPGRAGRYVQRR